MPFHSVFPLPNVLSRAVQHSWLSRRKSRKPILISPNLPSEGAKCLGSEEKHVPLISLIYFVPHIPHLALTTHFKFMVLLWLLTLLEIPFTVALLTSKMGRHPLTLPDPSVAVLLYSDTVPWR